MGGEDRQCLARMGLPGQVNHRLIETNWPQRGSCGRSGVPAEVRFGRYGCTGPIEEGAMKGMMAFCITGLSPKLRNTP